jgi:hypothetical protein
MRPVALSHSFVMSHRRVMYVSVCRQETSAECGAASSETLGREERRHVSEVRLANLTTTYQPILQCLWRSPTLAEAHRLSRHNNDVWTCMLACPVLHACIARSS